MSKFTILLHTRSRTADYGWVLGSDDRSLEDQFEQAGTQLAPISKLMRVPDIAAFAAMPKHGALMIARRSSSRTDVHDRQIYERCWCVWPIGADLRYRHLPTLLKILDEEVSNAILRLPDSGFSPLRDTRQVEVDPDNLEPRRDEERLRWEFPYGLTWEEIRRLELVVEVPWSMSFVDMLVPLWNERIAGDLLPLIGCHLQVDAHWNLPGPRILSAGPSLSNGDKINVRILRRDGEALDESAVAASRQRMTSARQTPAETPLRPNPTEGRRPAAEKPDSMPDVSRELMKRASSLAGNLDERATGRGWGVMQWIKGSDETGVRQLSTRLALLVSVPVSAVPNALAIAWSHLLREVELFERYDNAELRAEWVRRIEALYRLTIQAQADAPDEWLSEFKVVYTALRKFLRQ